MTEKKYTIDNLSEKQLMLISKSLELYTRLGLLQLERAILDEVSWSDDFTYTKNRDLIDLKIKEIRKLLVDSPDFKNYGLSSWSFGVGNKRAPRSTDITYEMYNDISDFMSTNKEYRGNLKLSQEDNIIVQDSNERLNKMLVIMEKLNKKDI